MTSSLDGLRLMVEALQATVAGQGATIRALQEQLAELQGNGGAEGAEEEG